MKAIILAALLAAAIPAQAKTFETQDGARFVIQNQSIFRDGDRANALLTYHSNDGRVRNFRMMLFLSGCTQGYGAYRMDTAESKGEPGVWSVGGGSVIDNVATHVCFEGLRGGGV